MIDAQVVGTVSKAVLETLGDVGKCYNVGDAIYLGESNINHMIKKHKSIYLKYHDKLPQVISNPDYIGVNDENGSLEYIKIFSEYIKIAVRVAGDNKLYVRTMYQVLKSRTDFLVNSGKLKPLTAKKK